MAMTRNATNSHGSETEGRFATDQSGELPQRLASRAGVTLLLAWDDGLWTLARMLGQDDDKKQLERRCPGLTLKPCPS